MAKKKKSSLKKKPLGKPIIQEKKGMSPLGRSLLAVTLFMASAILILSFFDNAGTFGSVLNEWILSFLFGQIRFVLPVLLIVFGVFLLKGKSYNFPILHKLGAVLLLISLSGLMHINYDPQDMWIQAVNGFGGGALGMIAWPMKVYLGEIASIVVLVGFATMSAILLFHEMISDIKRSIEDAREQLLAKQAAAYEDGEYDEFEDEEDEGRFFNKRKVDPPKELYEDDDDAEMEEDEELYEDEDEEAAESFVSAAKAEKEPYEEKREDVGDTKVLRQSVKKDDIDIPEYQKNVVIRKLPPMSLLQGKASKPTSGDIKQNEQIIRSTLSEFNIPVEMKGVRVGPTVTQFAFKPASGVKLSKITALHNDLALALAAHPLRIEAPIPGKSLVGIEIPNEKTAMVSLKELFMSDAFRRREHDMMVALGKDVGGKVWFTDLPNMPHLLVAGTTGSGKTVCVNTIIMSLLYQNTAETLRMIMVDPKRVELTLYNGIPHLLTPVITNTQKTVNALKWAIGEMERRFEVLQKAGSRDIKSYNKKNPDKKLPYIVFIIDELADLMAQAANEIESGIIRLAQMARAVGIHLVVATQRPSVDVITGLMKANIPGRIAFSVASLTDSRTILDCPGAEKLIGRGDMLLSTAALGKPVRIQGAYISEQEVHDVVEYLRGDEEPNYDDSITSTFTGIGEQESMFNPDDSRDSLFEEAKAIVLESQKASASYIQRRLRVGYARAARILDELEEAGVIGPANGSKAREIYADAADTSAGAGQKANVYKETKKSKQSFDDEQDDDEDVTMFEGEDEEDDSDSDDDQFDDMQDDSFDDDNDTSYDEEEEEHDDDQEDEESDEDSDYLDEDADDELDDEDEDEDEDNDNEDEEEEEDDDDEQFGYR